MELVLSLAGTRSLEARDPKTSRSSSMGRDSGSRALPDIGHSARRESPNRARQPQRRRPGCLIVLSRRPLAATPRARNRDEERRASHPRAARQRHARPVSVAPGQSDISSSGDRSRVPQLHTVAGRRARVEEYPVGTSASHAAVVDAFVEDARRRGFVVAASACPPRGLGVWRSRCVRANYTGGTRQIVILST